MTSFDRALRKAYRKPGPASSGSSSADATASGPNASPSQDAEREFASGAWYRVEGAASASDRPATSLRRRVVSARRRSTIGGGEESTVAPVDRSQTTAWRTIERKSGELEASYDELARLERRIAEREAAISGAEADLNETYSRLQQREEALAQRERLLRDREGLLNAKEQELSRTSHELSERSGRLERERSELQSLQADLRRRSDAVREAQATVESEKLSLKQRQEALAVQQATLDSQRAELARQKTALAEHERSMHDHERNLAGGREQIDAQRNELAAQKELLDRQHAELAASLERWEASAGERKEREQALSEKEQGLKSRHDDLSAQQSRLRQREAELRLRQSALSEREAELKMQEARLRLQVESYSDHEVAFKEMRKRFEEQQDQLVERTEELARRQEELDRESARATTAAAPSAPQAVYDAGSDLVEKLRATESLRSGASAPAPAKPAGTTYRFDAPQGHSISGPHATPRYDDFSDRSGGVAISDRSSSMAISDRSSSAAPSFETQAYDRQSEIVEAPASFAIDETVRPMWEVDEFDWPPICRMLTQTETDQFAALGQAIVDCARQGKKIWGVTSLVGGVGKTTLSLCLAAWLGQQQHDVLLVDGNFAHSEIAERLGISGQTCWRRTIDGSLPWGEVTIASVKDHLSVAPLAVQGGGPDVTLLDPRVQTSLQAIAGAYDVLLVDLPTMPSQSLRHRKLPFDACLIVTQGDKTPRDALLRAADQLRKAGIEPVAVAENG